MINQLPVSRDQKPVRIKITPLFLILMPFILSACVPNIGGPKTSGGAGEFVKGKVVSGFPNVPLYKGSVVVETYGSEDAWGGSFILDEDLPEVLRFYQEALPKLGWDTEVQRLAESNYVFGIKNQQYRGSVIVNMTADVGATAITVAVAKR